MIIPQECLLKLLTAGWSGRLCALILEPIDFYHETNISDDVFKDMLTTKTVASVHIIVGVV